MVLYWVLHAILASAFSNPLLEAKLIAVEQLGIGFISILSIYTIP